MTQSEIPAEKAVVARRLRWARFAVFSLVLGMLFLAYRNGLFGHLSNPQDFARAVLDLGLWGYIGFIVAYTCLQPFGVPGTVFIVAAPLIWPWYVAFVLSMIGTMNASIVGFSFARFIARDWFAARIPKRFHKYDEALERHALRTVFTLRMIFWMPQVLHAFLGVSKVPFWTHVWGSFLGYIPPLFVVSYFTSEVFEPTGQLKPNAWMVMGGLFAMSLTFAFAARHIERRWLARSK